jgi:microcystin degradation protein MlrC
VELIRRGCRFIAAKLRFAQRPAVAQQHLAAAGASLQLRCVGLCSARSSIALTKCYSVLGPGHSPTACPGRRNITPDGPTINLFNC